MSSGQATAIFALEGAGRTYDGHRALAPLDFTLARGERVVLIGPSGAGKSTVIKLLVGLVRPSEGRVLFEGRDLAGLDLLSVRRRLGYVIQEGGLFPHLTAAGNVALVAREIGWPRARIAARLRELAALVRLDPGRLERYPAELSGGQRQRVGLMRALMLEPELLLLDEPLGALDPMIRYELQVDLKAIFARLDTTVLMVTHDLHEAHWFGDRIVLMRDGRIVQEGRFPDLVERPADDFVRRFLRAQGGLAMAQGGGR